MIIPRGIHSIIEFVKYKQKDGNFENREKRPTKQFLQKFLRNYNKTHIDDDIVFPPNRPREFVQSPENLKVQQNAYLDKKFLDTLVPLDYPNDSYFEAHELDCLERSKDSLRFPPKAYIRKYSIYE